ncbi:MAG: NADH-quinone oxidoreductase subunit L [Myxococcales bacterium]|nr:NADH-quinone oxidoreductase subunit L [Myxococcales bacterium]
MLALICALPLVGAIVNGLMRGPRLVSGGIATAMVGISAVLSFITLFEVMAVGSGGTVGGGLHLDPVYPSQTLWTWMQTGGVDVSIGFRADPLTAVMMCVITGIGSLIHLYSVGYMDDEADKNSVWRFFSYLNLFIFAMLLLVMGDSFPLMFVGWEGVGLCSYLLIGFWYQNSDFASAGKKAFITNRIGDFSFLIGLFWLYWSLGSHATFNFVELAKVIELHPELVGGFGGCAVTGICLLFFGGATGKSAQLPLFVWLPDAMAGPTPVSALIHAATMVTSGIYMICRLNFLYVLAPAALATVATIGALTALFAATIAITQNDIKKVLAYSTVSQLGFMFLGVGVGGFTAGFFHVLTHAFFKALMFLGSGSIIHALHHEQDMRKMGGLRKYMPITFATFFAGYLAIIGFPLFSGFVSKDEILWLTYSTSTFSTLPMGDVMPKVLWLIGLATALMTAFYMSRLMFMTFFGTYRGGHADHGHDAHAGHDAHGGHAHTPHESPLVLTLPLMVLAVLSVFGGALNLPHWFPMMQGGMEHLLAPVFNPAGHAVHAAEGGATEFILMGLTTAGVFASVGAAFMLYVRKPEMPASIAAKIPLLYTGSLNKWFVDEIYQAAILTPIVTVSRQVLWAVVDAQIIDGAVNGAGTVARRLGELHGRIGWGKVQVYAISIALGTALIVCAYALGGV